MVSGKQVLTLALGVILIAAALTVITGVHQKTAENEAPEFSEVDDLLGDLESFLEFENQEYYFELSDLYSGWE